MPPRRASTRTGAGALAAAAAATALVACSGGAPGTPDGAADAPADAVADHCGNGVVDPGEVCDDGRNDALGGGCLPGCQAVDDSDQVFARPLVEVALTLPAPEWELLRHERKPRHVIFGGADCRNVSLPSPYLWHEAEVTIDGVALGAVGLRKKGHLGSQTDLRPALKLDFDRVAPGRRYEGLEGVALNNDRSDPSHARSCVSYQVFRAAGIPAPRCTLAHVTVNGEDQGVYGLVEEIDAHFLARQFAQPGGNLYEGTANDFRPDAIGGFDRETNQGDPSRADLDAMLAALNATDGEVEAALAAVIDLDQFYRFWATEIVVWHRDGYSGNANNFYLYADPGRGGRMVFLPWGTDAALSVDNRPEVPDSVLAFSALSRRLISLASGRDRLNAEVDAVLAEAWRPTELVAEVDRIGQVADPVLLPARAAERASAAAAIKAMILGRADAIAAARAAGDAWSLPLRTLPCRVAAEAITGTVTTRWDTLGQTTYATGALTLTVAGQPVVAVRSGARAGLAGVDGRILATVDSATRRYAVTLNFPDPEWFDPFDVVGPHDIASPPLTITVVESDLTVTPAVVLRRLELGGGTWTFSAASRTAGAPIAASFTSTLYLPL